MTVENIDFTKFKYCECGYCGELIPIKDKQGRPRRFKRGHNIRTGIIKWSKGYLIIYKPDHHQATVKGYVVLHRFVYEYFHRCCLLPWFDIHHINEIKTDNHRHNLLPVTDAQHTKIHMIKDMSGRFCLLCGSNKTNLWHRYHDEFVCESCFSKTPERIEYMKTWYRNKRKA